MPYTISHAAAALPFSRFRWLRMDAAIIATCIPDFGYYINWPLHLSHASHSLLGSLYLGIPISAIVLFIVRLLRPEISAVLNLKEAWKLHSFGFKELLWILISTVLGIWSHVVLDAFTHKNGWGVENFPFLLTSVSGLQIFKLLQYSFSAIGILALLAFYLINSEKLKDRAWFWAAGISIGSLLALCHLYSSSPGANLKVIIVETIVVFTRFLILFVIMTAIAMKVRRKINKLESR